MEPPWIGGTKVPSDDHDQEAAIPIYGKTTFCFQEETSSVAKMASWYNTDDVTGLFQRPRSGASRPSSAASPRTQSPLPHPPAINPTLLSTQPIPSSALVYAAAAAGKDNFSSHMIILTIDQWLHL